MNWFTKGYGQIVTDMMDPCEHLKEGDKAHVVHTETDSFGPVGKIALCEQCENERIEVEKQETEFCYDCKQEKPKPNVNEWRWYYFYAPQGDEPLLICNDCWDKPKHQHRMKKDTIDYENEMGD
jgi:hypothetical protein